ncbi:MAG: hypothetical protein ABI837_08735, partial [Acidobacteriota bacterium]
MILSASLLSVCPLFSQSATEPKPVGIDATVGAIQSLENVRDPKCDATATRLENFMYGTPLSAEARERKVDLQKVLILRAWSDASDAAHAASEDAVSAAALKPIIARALPFTIDEKKDVHVKLADGSELLLTERDARQYATVAYALRAILAVQQDALLTANVKLVPLSPDSIAAMKQMVDIYTLSVLNLSDQAARKAGDKQLSSTMLAEQWKRIAPIATGSKPPLLEPRSSQTAEAQPGEVLRKIVDQKLVSFATYNSNADPLLYSNIQSFYARQPWPSDKTQVKAITENFSNVVMDFIAGTLLLAERKAKAEKSPVIREKHIRAVYEETAPYSVNIYEDVIFFDRLPRQKQVYLEAYDADSLRDSGLHWRFIRQIINNKSFPLILDVDPF